MMLRYPDNPLRKTQEMSTFLDPSTENVARAAKAEAAAALEEWERQVAMRREEQKFEQTLAARRDEVTKSARACRYYVHVFNCIRLGTLTAALSFGLYKFGRRLWAVQKLL